jgi:predicted nucleic acid-binding protein
MQAQALPIIVPTLLLPQVAAAISRGRDDAALAQAFASAVRRLPYLVWVPLDEVLAQQSVDVAAQHRLRGSDAVYAAVALRFGSTLITLDQEQRDRLAGAVTTRYPAEALAEL